MAKTYFNDAIIGNSRMLGCLTRQGVLQRLFWPNIDHMQLIDRFEAGVKLEDTEAVFLADPRFETAQEYRKGTNILNTTYLSKELGLKILQTDFCLTAQDVLIRRYEIENLSGTAKELRFLQYSSAITATSHYTSTLFDYDEEALVHYQRDIYLSVSADREAESFQVGGDALNALQTLGSGRLQNAEDVLMVPEGALTWELGVIDAGTKKRLTLQICFAPSHTELKKLLKEVRKTEADTLYQATGQYWFKYLESCKPAAAGEALYNDLYERTLLVFKLMYDESSGGLMAAPEPDENRED